MIESDQVRSKGDVMARLKDIERQLREIRAERRLESSTIAAGRLVITGGSVKVVDSNGTTIALLGDLNELLAGQKGFWLGRPGASESMAISVFGTGTGGDGGFVGLWDRSGVYIVTDDAQSGAGLARPYLATTMGEVTVPASTTTSGTFVDLSIGVAAVHHPVMFAHVLVYSSAGGTTGEVTMAINGTPVGPTISVAGGEFGFRDIGPFALGSARPAYDLLVGISAQARRTAGAGQIGLRVLSVLGLESAYA